MQKSTLYILILLSVFALPSMLRAEQDPVLRSIEEASRQYREGGFSAALISLDAASQVIRQKKCNALERLLPKPMSGWTSQQEGTATAGNAAFGGAITAEQRYTKAQSLITVRFSTDSPMMQSMLMMFNNPIFSSSAGTAELIKGQKAIVDFSETSGNINMLVGSNTLITIEGTSVTRDELIAAAGMIDMDALTRLP
jgi:hypothetical protein